MHIFRFDKDDSQKSRKLEEVDLDDVLNRAKQHEMVAVQNESTSLGGEGFLEQFANVSDVKTNMNWEDVIPAEEQQWLEHEEGAQHTEELRKTPSQKAMELKEHNVHVLVRSLQKWGGILQRYDTIVAEAKLTEKNCGMIRDVSDDIIELCARAVKENNDEKRQSMEVRETLTSTQKSKAVLVTCCGVANINAETVLSRPRDLQILFKYLNLLDDDKHYARQFPIENIRRTLNWSGHWGPSEDAMLLIGAYRYGFGNWESMAKDPCLALQGKFLLDESKKGEDAASKPVPDTIHLVRRGDYLLGILRKHNEKIRAIESHLMTRRDRDRGRDRERERERERDFSTSKVLQWPPPVPVASTSHTASIRRHGERGSHVCRRGCEQEVQGRPRSAHESDREAASAHGLPCAPTPLAACADSPVRSVASSI